jgi:hypothetical protein
MIEVVPLPGRPDPIISQNEGCIAKTCPTKGPYPRHSCEAEVKKYCGNPPNSPPKPGDKCYGKRHLTKYKTANFDVDSASGYACEIAVVAEYKRCELAVEYTGQPLGADASHPNGRNWGNRVKVFAQIGNNIPAGAKTDFIFDKGQVFGWRMNLQGPLNQVLDTVIPHEVSHLVTATESRGPFPRWADEGMALSAETDEEKCQFFKILITYLMDADNNPNRSTVSFDKLLTMMDYPRQGDKMSALYVQGWSLTEYLLQQGGGGCQSKRKFLNAMKKVKSMSGGFRSINNWNIVLGQEYGINPSPGKSVASTLQDKWLKWIMGQLGPEDPEDPAERRAKTLQEIIEERIKNGCNPCTGVESGRVITID